MSYVSGRRVFSGLLMAGLVVVACTGDKPVRRRIVVGMREGGDCRCP